MSRIGRAPISIPNGVTITQTDTMVSVKGSKGELSQAVPRGISLEIIDNVMHVRRANDNKQTRAFHGLLRSLINNMVIGVTEGFTKKLELVGTGYRARKQGNNVVISAGYSHPVEYKPRTGITLETEGETVIIVSGIDKHAVGQTAAEIRKVRKPEPYKGKGIRYQNEVIRRKAGKAAKA